MDTMTETTPTTPSSPAEMERRWQERWAADGLYDVDLEDRSRPAYYFLTMLPYPSGDLHLGHWFVCSPSDTRARFLRMKGYNVFFPIGFDAFGLPAENAAIKRQIHPADWTYANMEKMRSQFRSMGPSFPWQHEVVTCEPEYYRWNQWFFIQFLKRGWAYRKFAPVDWCTSCNTTLAREQVVGEDRHCERCGSPVIKKELHQWFLRITDYAEELLDFSGLDWPERVKTLQENWIGRKEGAEILFPAAGGETVKVFTTRPDTLWGATFVVLAPEHPLVPALTSEGQRAAVAAYVEQASRFSEVERAAENREKTGVALGTTVTNPATGEEVPVWIADYVLADYGFGAVMAVPAHDQRDFEFASRHGLEVRWVIAPPAGPEVARDAAYSDYAGVMTRSGPLDGVAVGKAAGESIPAAIAWLEAESKGKGVVTYRLRDWLVSRQRYWGTPIPVIYCPRCGTVPVPEDELPLTLPRDVDFRKTGENPLRAHPTWRFTPCPRCGEAAERETDTMDTFVDSSWYQYRYLSPHYADGPFDPACLPWLPVFQYTGGIEHATMHLMYTRFWTRLMRDMGLVPFSEPMTRLFNQGIILGPDGRRMSKSRGNVVDPDELVARYGADTVRCFLMFLGPWDQGGPWSPTGIEGIVRWLNRVKDLASSGGGAADATALNPGLARDLERKLHQTIRNLGDDTEAFRFNTAISRMMELANLMMKARAELAETTLWTAVVRTYLLLLAPYAPHLAEELWAARGYGYSIHQQTWPTHSDALAAEDELEVVVQVNGKLRDKLSVAPGTDRETLERLALAAERAQPFLADKTVRKVIVVPDKLVNIVVG